jgi:hypothetical protein
VNLWRTLGSKKHNCQLIPILACLLKVATHVLVYFSVLTGHSCIQDEVKTKLIESFAKVSKTIGSVMVLIVICKVKKVKLSLCLTEHHSMMMYWGVEA